MVDDASVNPWALFESIPEMVVVVDNDGIVLYSNAHSLDILGWSPAELVGQKIEVLVPDRLHTAHRSHRYTYAHGPKARPMGSGLLLTASHRNGQRGSS